MIEQRGGFVWKHLIDGFLSMRFRPIWAYRKNQFIAGSRVARCLQAKLAGSGDLRCPTWTNGSATGVPTNKTSQKAGISNGEKV